MISASLVAIRALDLMARKAYFSTRWQIETGSYLLLFGAIMVIGLNTLVRSKEDLMEARNLTIVALILIFGIGGMSFSAGDFALQGIGLAGVLGVLLNLLLPGKKKAS